MLKFELSPLEYILYKSKGITLFTAVSPASRKALNKYTTFMAVFSCTEVIKSKIVLFPLKYDLINFYN